MVPLKILPFLDILGNSWKLSAVFLFLFYDIGKLGCYFYYQVSTQLKKKKTVHNLIREKTVTNVLEQWALIVCSNFS